MSDALNFLVKARPDAMGHYFKFLKETGKHLDPKTRNLISVITKVHAQTDRGFRQYLSRALREGCTPAEILDALLMAFPALGLAKIVWAVDILIDMDLPEFQADAMGFPAHARRKAAADIEVGTTQRHDCDGRGLFVHRTRTNSASTTAAVRTRPPTSRTWHSTERRLPAPSTSGPSTSRPARASPRARRR